MEAPDDENFFVHKVSDLINYDITEIILIYISQKNGFNDPYEAIKKLPYEIWDAIASISDNVDEHFKNNATANKKISSQTDGSIVWAVAVLKSTGFMQRFKDESDIPEDFTDQVITKGVEYIKSTRWFYDLKSNEEKNEAVNAFSDFIKDNFVKNDDN
jgi:hypothetical protein